MVNKFQILTSSIWKLDKCPPIDVLLLLSKRSIALYLNTGLAQNKKRKPLYKHDKGFRAQPIQFAKER